MITAESSGSITYTEYGEKRTFAHAVDNNNVIIKITLWLASLADTVCRFSFERILNVCLN